MAAWPVTLPTNPIADSFAPVPPPLKRRTEFDTGPAFQRRVATAGVWTFSGLQFVLSSAQVATFQGFWTTDISDGADSFDFDIPSDWPIPGAGTTQTFRITGGYGLTPRSRGIRWTLEIDMELLP